MRKRGKRLIAYNTETLLPMVQMMTDEQAGKVLKGVLLYCVDGTETDIEDPLSKVMYEQIQYQVRRDYEKYEYKRGIKNADANGKKE